MIHWIVQAAADQPSIERGEAPSGLLSHGEAGRLAELSVDKRRRDWLLGRWTAKELVRSVLESRFALSATPAEIEIGNDADGAPFVRCLAPRLGLVDADQRLPWSLSISHSHGVAVSALVIGEEHQDGDVGTSIDSPAGAAVGADIEFCEPRAPSFARDFFTEPEVALVEQSRAGERDYAITAIWSAKEAVLKALRTGLRLDTRAVQCLVRPPHPVGDTWRQFAVEPPPAGRQGVRWFGWWRRPPAYPDAVLTLALMEKSSVSQNVGR